MSQRSAIAGSYSFGRTLARLWLRKLYRRVRLLRAETIPPVGPLLLVVNGEPEFLNAMGLAVSLERPVRSVLPVEECTGFWRQQVATRLEMILHEPDAHSQVTAVAAVRDALRSGEAVAIFAQPETARSEALSPSCVAAAKLVVEAETGRAGGTGTVIIPLHIVSSYGTRQFPEMLIAMGSPLGARSFLGGSSGDASVRTLAGELENRLTENPFRLQERDVKFFVAELEKVLRAELEEDWAARPNWKQKTDGFEISRFIIECAEQLNAIDPPRLIGLEIELEDYREQLRQWSLHQAEIKAAGGWIESGALRAVFWLETILGFPVALYGFVNHLLPLALLSPRGLLRKMAEKDPGHAWLLRVLVVLACYVAQVSLCAHWWGRAVAGYYTITLPLSGAFLWHYNHVLKTRTRLLYLVRNLPVRAARLRQLRKSFLEKLNQVRDAYAEAIGAPR